jgi:hypothetical protein
MTLSLRVVLPAPLAALITKSLFFMRPNVVKGGEIAKVAVKIG